MEALRHKISLLSGGVLCFLKDCLQCLDCRQGDAGLCSQVTTPRCFFHSLAGGVFVFFAVFTRPAAELIASCILAEGRLGVQVVEGVGLVASGSQFITRLAPVFAEEVGGFILCGFNRTYTTLIFCG